MPGLNAMAVDPVIWLSGAVIYPCSRLVPPFPNPVARGSGCVMPWGSPSPSCELNSWKCLSMWPWTSLIPPRKGKTGWFPITSPCLALWQFPSMPAEQQARSAHQEKAEQLLTRRVKRFSGACYSWNILVGRQHCHLKLMKLLYKTLDFSGSTSALCSSLWQLAGWQDEAMLGMHPKTIPLQRRGPALPEGSLLGPPGGQDLKKKLLVLPGAVVAENRLWGMQFTLWFSLQCFLLAPRKENGNGPAGCFPKEVPPVPYSCPNTGKPWGTPDTLTKQPKIFRMPALLLVILHVQSVLKADLFFWHHFWIWDLPFFIPP